MIRSTKSAVKFAARAAWRKYSSTPWAWAADAGILAVIVVATIWWLR